MAQRKRRGRRPGDPALRRGSIFALRLTEDERERIDRAAERAKVTASTWARRILLGAAG